MFREAAITALVIFALAISLVGFETLDATGGIIIRTRFGDVGAVMAIGFVARIALILLREHRPMPVLLVAPVLTVAMLLVLLSETIFGADTGGALKQLIPFHDPIVLWGVMAVTAIFAMRAAYAVTHMSSSLTIAEREERMDQIAAGVQRAARLLGPLLLILAIALPFMPFADRRVLDIGILVLTYVMLGWG
ncbi:MAG: high-affinity branched-chain amino acid ABC transporter permease LivM, partial [Pseudomonadota bacterium]